MSSRWRRFEVLLPLQFNDGRPVPADWLAEAVLEIVDHFGAASYETQKVEGHWRHGGVLYRDDVEKDKGALWHSSEQGVRVGPREFADCADAETRCSAKHPLLCMRNEPTTRMARGHWPHRGGGESTCRQAPLRARW